MSLWEKLYFTAESKTYSLESGIDGFTALGNYDLVLKESFLFAILSGLIFSLLYYILVGRITYRFARVYYWLIPMFLTIPLSAYLTTIAIRHYFTTGGLGLFKYDLVIEPHDIHVIIISCIYALIAYFASSLLFKTRWFTIYHRHIPFSY